MGIQPPISGSHSQTLTFIHGGGGGGGVEEEEEFLLLKDVKLRHGPSDDRNRDRDELHHGRLHLCPPDLRSHPLRTLPARRHLRPQPALRSPHEHAMNGLESVMVAAIPMMKYNREAFHCREDVQCTICLGEYQDKEMMRIMPICGHNFHVDCIDVWLQKKSTCPVCRLSLTDSSVVEYAWSPVHGVQSADWSEASDNHSSQWLLPSHHQHLGGDGGNPSMINEPDDRRVRIHLPDFGIQLQSG